MNTTKRTAQTPHPNHRKVLLTQQSDPLPEGEGEVRARRRAGSSHQPLLTPQQRIELLHAPHSDDLDVGADLFGVRVRDQDAPEAEGRGFAGAEVGLGDAADLAEETDLAEDR